MKIKSVSITGMHHVGMKKYELNEGTTYFIGPNGAGKSTILEAIQFALLGYIPGYDKTNVSLSKHMMGDIMEVKLALDSGITIARICVKSGASAKTSLNVTGFEGEISDLIGDVELPVFNFGEFKSMTANQLKNWFIGFLPEGDSTVDVVSELKKVAEERVLPSEELLANVQTYLNSLSEKGVERIRKLNEYLKSEKSYKDGELKRLQGTVQSLVYYDDAPDADIEALRKEWDDTNEMRSEVVRYNAQLQAYNRALEQIERFKSVLSADCLENDKEYSELLKKVEEDEALRSELSEQNSELVQDRIRLENEFRLVPTAEATCPYTKEACETAAKLTAEFTKKAEEINTKLFEVSTKISQLNSQLTAVDISIGSNRTRLADLKNKYIQLDNLKAQAPYEPICSVDKSESELADKMNELRDLMIKVEANRKYDELMQTVTKDKFAIENEIEILKFWIKRTDANGLQTEMMDSPFLELADNISSYLTDLFGEPTKAMFNLQTKANSFSFGVDRAGKYIEYDYLSSGEKCLFSLALMLCLLARSNASLKVMLVDDILDHLDGQNAENLFKTLSSNSDVQFIMAGVKDCNIEEIKRPVKID